MVAIGVSTASSAPDAVSLARSSSGGKANSDGSGGFQDVLDSSGSGRDARKASTNSSSTARTGGTTTASPAPNDASQRPASPPQPDPNSKAPATVAAALPAAVTGQPELSAPPAEDMVPADAMAPGIAEQLAAMVADNGAGQAVADSKTIVPASKGDKTAGGTDSSTDDDTAPDANAANGAVADVLTLLGGVLPASVVPAQTAPSVLAAAGQLHGGNSKVAPSADAAVGAVPVDDQPTAAEAGMAMLASASGTLGNASADAGKTNSDDAAQTFSLERVSSKAQPQELAGAKAAEDTPQLDIKSAAGDSAGTVTVLESRRFVGLADGSNSALVANALTGNKDWAAAMQPSAALTGASATTSASKVMNSLKIQMNPENLGIVTATMRLSGEQLSVDLKVHSAEAYRQLSNDQTAMIDSLRQQGYSVDRVTVTYSSPDTSSNNNQPGAQGQQQQSGASQGQGSDAQARKQNSGRQAGDQDGVWGTGNLATDDIAAGGAQRARAGGVYL